MNTVAILTKIADTVAKKYDCRLKYDNKNHVIIFFGPENCKNFIVEESNETLKELGFPLICSEFVVHKQEDPPVCEVIDEDE